MACVGVACGWNCPSVKPDIKRILNLLEDVVGSLADQQSKSKAALFKAISPCIDAAISLFPVYLHDPGRGGTLLPSTMP